MNYIETLMSTLSTLSTLALQSIILGGTFVSVMLVVLYAGYWLAVSRSPVNRRLQEISDFDADEPHIEHHEGAFNVTWVEPVVKLMLPASEWHSSRLKTQLVHAGYRSNKALSIYFAAKLILALGLPFVLLFPWVVLGQLSGGAYQVTALVVVLASTGFFLPDIYLRSRIRDRQQSLLEAFPDGLDLLVVCVETGLALDGAIQRVGRELAYSWPVLSEEFSLVNLELQAGRSRKEALKALGERTGLQEINSLVSILIQAEHFGTSIASSLREHADEMRLSRIQRAREKAAKLPVKMVVPIVLFIFPALFLVILGPAAVSIYAGLIAKTG